MGSGYWIIVADGFGAGLQLINGRVYDEKGRNWWPCERGTPDEEISEKHQLDRFEFVRIVR